MPPSVGTCPRYNYNVPIGAFISRKNQRRGPPHGQFIGILPTALSGNAPKPMRANVTGRAGTPFTWLAVQTRLLHRALASYDSCAKVPLANRRLKCRRLPASVRTNSSFIKPKAETRSACAARPHHGKVLSEPCAVSRFWIPMDPAPRYLVPFHPKRVPHHFTDVLVIGGGLAGLRAADAIDRQLSVLVVTKESIRQSNSATPRGHRQRARPGGSVRRSHADTLTPRKA